MLRTAENRAREAVSRFRVRTVQCWKSLPPPLLPSGVVPTDTFSAMDWFVSIDSTIRNDVFHFHKVFCVFVSMYVLRLWRGSGWQLRMWFRLDMQGNSKKSWKRTLIQKILWYWVCPSCQRDLVCVGEEERIVMRENGGSHKQGAGWVRLSESGVTWYYRTQIYVGRIRWFSTSLGLSAPIPVSTLPSSLPLLVLDVSQESSTHLVVWPKSDLTPLT